MQLGMWRRCNPKDIGEKLLKVVGENMNTKRAWLLVLALMKKAPALTEGASNAWGEVASDSCVRISCRWHKISGDVIMKRIIGIVALLALASVMCAEASAANNSTGYINIWSSPSGAYIYLDDAYNGVTGSDWFLTLDVPPGYYTVTLEKSGYEDYTETVYVSAGDTVTVSASLSVNPTPTPEETPTQTPTGYICAWSSPSGAYIYLDGVYQGVTGSDWFYIYDVLTGYHTIRVEKFGYEDYTETVYVSAGDVVSVYAYPTEVPTVAATAIVTELPTGHISVWSNPSGADIYLDDAYQGATGSAQFWTYVSMGYHTIRLEKSGYEDYTETVYVSAGDTVTVSTSLSGTPTPTATTSSTGSIYVMSTPSGASIYLDDVYEGTTPNTISGVSLGSHTIRVEESGYGDYTKTVRVSAGWTPSVSASLSATPAPTPTATPAVTPIFTTSEEPAAAATSRETETPSSKNLSISITPIILFCLAVAAIAIIIVLVGGSRKRGTSTPTTKRAPPPEVTSPLEPALPEQTSPPEPEPIPPSDFTPRPTTPSTFPPELAHLYSDTVYAGKGGFARVFRAKRNTDNKTVAVKIPISLDEGTGRSFLREITSWQRLNHENIITLYDANILPIPYLEMEYASSGSLDQMNKPVDVDTASEIVLEITEGLSYSHAQGVIHRDLKPMNILLTEDLTPKISDWGLSKIIAESKTTSIYGFSPLYGSPEQISPKKFGKPDERTDIYQLGVIFYELLTGRTPFVGDDLVEVSTAIVTEEPTPPSSISPEAKIADPIVLKCLAKKKEDRYQNVRELQNDLASALKTQLKESLRMSVSEHNIKRSAFYCAEICLMHARLGEIDDVVIYLTDMQNYASEEVKTEVAELLKELERRKGMSSEEKISEEFVGRLKNVLHQVRMGR